MVGIRIKPKQELFEGSLEQALLKLRMAKQDQARITKEVFETEALVLELMEASGLKSTTKAGMRATVVRGETAVVNEVGLAKALGARAWNKITKKVLDRSKLEKALAEGEVDVNVVSQHTQMRPRKPFVRISEANAEEAQLDETQPT